MVLSYGWEGGGLVCPGATGIVKRVLSETSLERSGVGERSERMHQRCGCQKQQGDDCQDCEASRAQRVDGEQPDCSVRRSVVIHFIPPVDYGLVISQEMLCLRTAKSITLCKKHTARWGFCQTTVDFLWIPSHQQTEGAGLPPASPGTADQPEPISHASPPLRPTAMPTAARSRYCHQLCSALCISRVYEHIEPGRRTTTYRTCQTGSLLLKLAGVAEKDHVPILTIVTRWECTACRRAVEVVSLPRAALGYCSERVASTVGYLD